MDYAASRQGYLNLWKKAQLRPERAATARVIAKRIVANRERYEKISVQVGKVPWWWIAAIHNMEASGNFTTYLGNGQPFNKKTTIVPVGRGPFVSFEAGAVDAIRLKGLHKIPEWDISRALYEAERYNGWGYLGKVNSPYVWSFTNLYERGKYIRDHVYSSAHVSSQCGVAAIFKALQEMGAILIAPTPLEDDMSELRASLLPFGALAPILIRTLAGPTASIGLKALIEAFDDGDRNMKPDAKLVQNKLESVPLKKMPEILSIAEQVLKELGLAEPVVDQPVPTVVIPATVVVDPAALPPHATGPVITSSPVATGTGTGSSTATSTATSNNTTTIVSPEKDHELGIVDRVFGGRALAGLKTPAGILVYCAAWAASSLGYLSPEVTSALYALATALAGIGLTAKLDKILPWLSSLTSFIRR